MFNINIIAVNNFNIISLFLSLFLSLISSLSFKEWRKHLHSHSTSIVKMVEITLNRIPCASKRERTDGYAVVQRDRENPEYSKGTFLTAAIQICQISRGDVRESKN